METKTKRRLHWGLAAALMLPLVLIGLFEWLKGSRAVMDFWVFEVLAPVEQLWGRLWSLFPLSGMELLIAMFLLWNVVWLGRTAVLALRNRVWRDTARRIAVLAAAWLWLWCALCWLWNAAYYAATFSERSGLSVEQYSVEELAAVTEYFAQQTAELSGQVSRDGEGHFLSDREKYLTDGVGVYRNLEQEFPCLKMEPVEAKPILCSRLQSRLGFTGMYFPFTGEANVNIDAPACLMPSTIAHEMAHQRMVASELEASFVGIAACITGDDVVFQYSGYLEGLIHLCNALYSVDAQAWYDIADRYFTPELSTDWKDNNDYWRALESKVEEAAEQAYDSFLKGNDQELGMRSYGACVDLLVAYFGARADGNTAIQYDIS